MSSYRDYTLIFSSIPFGTDILGFTTQIRRVNEVQTGQYFWASRPFMKGNYPAIIYRHGINMVISAETAEAFAEDYLNLADYFGGIPSTMTLVSTVNSQNVTVDFGACLLEEVEEPERPDLLLRHPIGSVKIYFLGTHKPIITVT